MRFLALLAVLFALSATAQDTKVSGSLDDACKLITTEGLRKHLAVLASDDYEGRNAGYPGNDKAADYIAKFFKEIGLKPVGDRKSHFQKFEFPVRGGGGKTMTTRNCVGFVEGKDKKLKKEIVVIGAHHDHAGKTGQSNPGRMKGRGDDEIWNGADDNGSGTVTVMEIARAFMEGKIRTKRSVLFMTFSAEEHGLLGSRHYCDKPLFPMHRHVAMINLDMVGRNPESALGILGTGTSPVWEELVPNLAEQEGVDVQLSEPVSGGSDHASFAAKRVPAVHFFSGMHPDYHKNSDHSDRVAYEHMSKIGRFGLRLLVEIANMKKRPVFSGPKRLGVNGEDDAEGFRVTQITKGSVADKAGIEEGDVITTLNRKKLSGGGSLDKLKAAIKGAPDGKRVPVELLRNGRKKKVHVKWN